MDAGARSERLRALRGESDPARRRLVALALLADRLAEDGIEPILVGGAAVELYTAGGYATKDVDLALPTSPKVDRAFAELGFAKHGRYWYHDDLDLLFEAPAPEGLPGEESRRRTIRVEGLPVTVLGVEDLILDRLRAWVHWQSGEDRRWARRLAVLYRDELDWGYLRDRVSGDAGERRALAEIGPEEARP